VSFAPQPKPVPAVVEKLARRRRGNTLDRQQKKLVRDRDLAQCRVCGGVATDVHERLFKSLGGTASLANSLCACRLCHVYLQGHAIRPYGTDCNAALTFVMSPIVARHIFRGRQVPPHVEVR